MAVYRQIYCSYWTDTKVLDSFTPEDKYFYLYLLTNSHVNLCGCYELANRSMTAETGYTVETCLKLLERLGKVLNVIRYSSETKEVLLLNWHKYNWADSEKTLAGVYKSAESIKTPAFKEYVQNLASKGKMDTTYMGYPYPMDGVSIPTVTDTVSVSVTDTVPVTDSVNKKKGAGKRKVSKVDANIEMFHSLQDRYSFSDAVSAQIEKWLTYKGEGNFVYKEAGMKAFLSQAQKKVLEYGDDAVCDLMEECAGNLWQGVIWTKLERRRSRPSQGDLLQQAAQMYGGV